MLFAVPLGGEAGFRAVRRGFTTMTIGAVVTAALFTAACGGGSPSSAPSPSVNIINKASDIFTTLGVAGLGCPKPPTQLAAGPARVALCSPIAGIPKTFLTIGMYASPEIAAHEYQVNCRYGGWSLYRPGQNWRGAMGPKRIIPESVARKIAIAIHTDLRRACPPKSTPSG
jgi:hypothetical protein